MAHSDHRLSRRQLSALALVLVACGKVDDPAPVAPVAGKPQGSGAPPSDPAPPAPPATTQKPVEKPPEPPAGPPPSFGGASHGHIAQTLFWSWTTAEQEAEIRAGGPLFSRETRDDLGPGHLYTALDTLSQQLAEQAAVPDAVPDPRRSIIEALLGAAYRRGRYTWINPWATCAGYQGESYGDRLLCLELRPEAWIARFFSMDAHVDIVDLADQPVSKERFLAEPERLAGVYFVNGQGSGIGTFGGLPGAYREVYIGNRAMLARASVGTSAIHDVMTEAVTSLRALAKLPPPPNAPLDFDPAWEGNITGAWRYESDSVWTDYLSALCFPDYAYTPVKARLEALATTLESRLFVLDPLEIAT